MEEAESAAEVRRTTTDSTVPEITETSTGDGSYSWPVVHYDVAPYRTYHFYQQFRTTGSNPSNFLKGVKWSPDGSCFLTCSDDNRFRVFNMPYDDNGNPVNAQSSEPDSDSYVTNLVLSEGESVYDYCWYPQISRYAYSQRLRETILFISGMLIQGSYVAHIVPMMLLGPTLRWALPLTLQTGHWCIGEAHEELSHSHKTFSYGRREDIHQLVA